MALILFLTLTLALLLDYIKKTNPEMELSSYGFMFIAGGVLVLVVLILSSKTPEPLSYLPKENFLKLFKKPLADKNFRSLLIFNAFWSFALNIATPFFTVYMMRTLNLPLSTIICFAIAGQVASILAVRIWGKYADRFSNKTIIKIAVPLYILCILSWTFTGMLSSGLPVIILIGAINIFSGMATAGINLSIGNIGIKLAPKNEAIVYLSTKSMLVAAVSALGPLIGGFLADYFSTRSFTWNIQMNGPHGSSVIPLLELHSLTFLFIIGSIFAIGALRLLHFVREEGEMSKDLAIAEIKTGFKTGLKIK